MKVLLTGATGFLGRHILDQVTHVNWVALSRNWTALPATTIQGDVLDLRSLSHAMEGCDAVVHAAGVVSHHPDDAGRVWEVHVRGTENVLKAAKEAGVKRLIHLSSSGTVAVSDDPDFIATEDTPTPNAIIQNWPYYRAKLYAEQLVLDADLPVVCLNPTILFGPGDRLGTSTRPIRYFLHGRLPAVPSGGLSFVDVRDVADAVGLALSKGTPGARYLLGAVNMTFAAFFSRLSRIADRPEPLLRLPRFGRKVIGFLPPMPGLEGVEERIDVDMACHYWYLDASRARAELGWTPRDPIETLRDTVADIWKQEGRR